MNRADSASWRWLLPALVIVLLAAGLRFHLLGAQSLWNDEGNSYVQATRSFADIAANAARDIHPPGYYWLLKIWMVLTGESEFALRSLSAFASLLGVALTYALGRRLFSPLAGLAAALLVALNAFSIYYAQETRMYALLALWGVLGMGCLVGFLQGALRASPTVTRWALALALVNAAGLWTQYAYPFVMLAQAVIVVVWLVATWSKLGSPLRFIGLYIGANLLTLVLYLPWLPQALHALTSWPNTGEAVDFGPALGTLVGWFTFGITYRENDPSWIAVTLLLLVLGLRTRLGADNWRGLLVPVVWVLLPVGLFLALGMFREGNIKLLLPSQIALALWLGRGMDAVWRLEIPYRRWRLLPRLAVSLALAGIALNMWSGLAFLYHDPDYQRDNYRAIVREIEANLGANDAVILDAPNQEEVFRYYYAGAAPIYPLPEGLGGDDQATRSQVRQIIDAHRQLFAVYWGETERDPQRVVEGTLSDSAYEAGGQWFGDVRLVRYATPVELPIEVEVNAPFGDAITLERYALSADTVRPGDLLQLRLDWRTDSALQTRYKVFIQLLDADGRLVAQRDSEPGNGLALTTTWTPDDVIQDQHALIIPNNLSPANYSLILGLYNGDDPQARLPVNNTDYLQLTAVTVEP